MTSIAELITRVYNLKEGERFMGLVYPDEPTLVQFEGVSGDHNQIAMAIQEGRTRLAVARDISTGVVLPGASALIVRI